MKMFRQWLETKDVQNKLVLINNYIKSIVDLAAKYNSPVHSNFIESEKQFLLNLPDNEFEEEIKNIPRRLEQYKKEFESNIKTQKEKKRKNLERLSSPGGRYDKSSDSHERIICDKGNPKCEENGMEAFSVSNLDPSLKGYYGVHVGGGWLGILKRDGYCSEGDAYIYTIHTDEMIKDGIDIYQMDDPHIAYKDSVTPNSWIIYNNIF